MDIKTFKPSSHKIKAVIYGASGSGKTYFAATAPKPIFASAEAGLLSTMSLKKKIDYVEIKSVADLAGMLRDLKADTRGYETVIIDSISEINDICKDKIESDKKRSMQIQDWGELGKIIRKILRGFRDLDMHVIFIAQEKIVNDADKIDKRVPMLNGKSATEIAYFMDVSGYIYVTKEGEHKIRTAPDHRLLTKDRTGKIGDDAPVDFQKWIDRMSKLKLENEEVKKVGLSEDVKPENNPDEFGDAEECKKLYKELKAKYKKFAKLAEWKLEDTRAGFIALTANKKATDMSIATLKDLIKLTENDINTQKEAEKMGSHEELKKEQAKDFQETVIDKK